MRRIALAAALAAAVAVPAALAADGEPQHKFTKADQARAKATSLRLSDFAQGWRSVPNKDSKGPAPRCKAYSPNQSDLIETGKYDSPDFTRSDGSIVSVTTGVFKTTAMAKTAFNRVATPHLPKCFGELLSKQSPTTVLSAGPLPFPSAGDASRAYRLVVTIKTPARPVKAIIDFVVFVKGRTDVAMVFFGLVNALPATLEQQAAGLVLRRA